MANVSLKPPQEPGTLTRFVQHYVTLRDKRKALKKAFTIEDAKFKDVMDTIEAYLLRHFNANPGLENIKTEAGTAYKSERNTASLQDPALFMDYVIKNQRFDLLDRKANTTAVVAHTKEKGEDGEVRGLPPGAKLSTMVTVGVHRASGGKDDDE